MGEEKKEGTGIVVGVYQLGDFYCDVKPQEIQFFEKNADGTTLQSGTTLEEMLRVSIERLQLLNSKFSSCENSIAITKMQEALMWLNARTADRIKRGVEGKHEV